MERWPQAIELETLSFILNNEYHELIYLRCRVGTKEGAALTLA